MTLNSCTVLNHVYHLDLSLSWSVCSKVGVIRHARTRHTQTKKYQPVHCMCAARSTNQLIQTSAYRSSTAKSTANRGQHQTVENIIHKRIESDIVRL